MTQPPELSTVSKRRLELLWKAALDRYGFNGEHLHWHEEERERRLRAASQMSTRNSGLWNTGDCDEVGIRSSTMMAEERYGDYMKEYERIWRSSGEGYERLQIWAEAVKHIVSEEIASVWQVGPKEIRRWYAACCVPALDEALSEKVKESVRRALSTEMQRIKSDVEGAESSEGGRKNEIRQANISAFKPVLVDRGTSGDDACLPGSGHVDAAAMEGKSKINRQAVILHEERERLVADFIMRCNDMAAEGERIFRNHIWKAAGHKQGRQFSYWLQGSQKATETDDRTIRRVLSMEPLTFIETVQRKGHLKHLK
jgi:hypothetical protein